MILISLDIKIKYTIKISAYISNEIKILYKGTYKISFNVKLRTLIQKNCNNKENTTKKIYGIISDKIALKILVLYIIITKTGKTMMLKMVLYVTGRINIDASDSTENVITYKIFWLLVVFIFNIVVNNSIERYASRKVKGEQIILVNTWFSVVNNVQIVWNRYIG